MTVSPAGTQGRAAVLAQSSAFVSPRPAVKTSHQVVPTPAQQTAFVTAKASGAASSGAQAAQAARAGEQAGQQLDVKL